MEAKKITALNFPALLHGADYNPEQWLDHPEILEQDIQMMKQTHCNVMSVGIFSWSLLEPTEGEYHFSWLDDVLNQLYSNGIHVFLATPSGARPAWLSAKYPQVLRMDEQRRKALHGGRHNHCLSSPVYRAKVRTINQQLASRYAHHPAVIGWHISNEYGGECHCSLCQAEFRQWLKNKYQTLEALNQAWWSNFWSHTYTDWNQIESPSSIGENSIHGLNLDWKRFNTAQVIDFCQNEIDSVKPFNPEVPVTTNFMEYFYDYDYWEFAKILDFVCWDNYPLWHGERSDRDTGAYVAMYHDLIRSLKPGLPFLLMESTPSLTNWQPISKLKKPGMHILSSMQAIAHGANSVQYFQWRKSRGSVEKFHGAVVDHVGHVNTRVGQEVTQLGTMLNQLSDITTTTVKAEVAIVFDWDNRWAMDNAQGPRNKGLFYEQTVNSHYLPFWEMGINVDIVNQQSDLSGYKLVIAPMSYMVKENFANELDKFVRQGGCLVCTYWSGIVQENDLCFLGGFPGPLKSILGIWSEEIDCLDDHESNQIMSAESNELELMGPYKASQLCDLIHLESARALAYYQQDFYQGYPALTVNQYGQGQAYYITSKNDEQFQYDFTKALVKRLQIATAIPTELPKAVTAHVRENEHYRYIFIENFNNATTHLDLPQTYDDALSNTPCHGQLELAPFAVKILREEK